MGMFYKKIEANPILVQYMGAAFQKAKELLNLTRQGF
jgi:hypothetical protein